MLKMIVCLSGPNLEPLHILQENLSVKKIIVTTNLKFVFLSLKSSINGLKNNAQNDCFSGPNPEPHRIFQKNSRAKCISFNKPQVCVYLFSAWSPGLLWLYLAAV